MRNLVILAGSSHPELVSRICHNLAIDASEVDLSKFSNGETSVMIKDSVREKDVYVIQSGCGDVNDNFIELLIMISACKTASAKKVTAVLPLFPYSRQPDLPYTKSGAPLKSGVSASSSFTFESVPSTPKPMRAGRGGDATSTAPPSLALASNLAAMKLASSGGSPIPGTPRKTKVDPWNPGEPEPRYGYRQWIAQAGTLIASLLTCAGADHIITMDLHDPQFQGYFDIPVDNLYGKPLLQNYITTKIPNYQEAVIVSPDAGGAKRATAIADSLGMAFALIHKERRPKPQYTTPQHHLNDSVVHEKRPNATTIMVGDVSDRVAILIDDLCDTANTITRAAKLIKDQGATEVYAIVTHGLFNGDAIERIKASAIDKVVTTNSTPQEEHQQLLGDKLEVLDVSRVFGEAIRRIHNGESVSMLFDHYSI
ncbi:ribose-phosphate pyrophosphokinase 5 [Trichomonascus vanleenenianus]|uniref:ribose phosphate diphosphokinase subunit PRS5 n=1 Tax=Trichomonascus vanleenenianus TaxID=2268995 RepID=UPI003EC99F0C